MSASPIRSLFALATTAALATACSVRTHDKAGNETASISFGDGNAMTIDAGDGNSADKTVAINVPGFSAKVAVPGLAIGGKNADIDGIALYPGTRMNGVNIDAGNNDGTGGESQGRVDMAFTAPASPDQLLSYYKGAARNAGWSEQPPAAGQQFAATKTDDKGKLAHLAMSVTGAGTGSSGHFQIDGE
jgi:hypothetical protein